MVERLEVRGRCSGSARVGWKICSVWFITVPWLTEQAQGSRRSNLGIFLDALLFIGPSYVANAAPLLLGGGTPLDGERTFSMERGFWAHTRRFEDYSQGS